MVACSRGPSPLRETNDTSPISLTMLLPRSAKILAAVTERFRTMPLSRSLKTLVAATERAGPEETSTNPSSALAESVLSAGYNQSRLVSS